MKEQGGSDRLPQHPASGRWSALLTPPVEPGWGSFDLTRLLV